MSITLNCLLIVFTHFEMSSKNLPSSTLLKYLPLGDNLASLRRNDSQATIVIRCQRILFISTVVYRKGYCFNGEELVSLLIGDAIHDKQIHVLPDALYYSINTLYAEQVFIAHSRQSNTIDPDRITRPHMSKRHGQRIKYH